MFPYVRIAYANNTDEFKANMSELLMDMTFAMTLVFGKNYLH